MLKQLFSLKDVVLAHYPSQFLGYENETEFSISDKSYVDKTTTTYIYIEQELKDTKENTRKQENVERYGIYVSKDLVTDYTD